MTNAQSITPNQLVLGNNEVTYFELLYVSLESEVLQLLCRPFPTNKSCYSIFAEVDSYYFNWLRSCNFKRHIKSLFVEQIGAYPEATIYYMTKGFVK